MGLQIPFLPFHFGIHRHTDGKSKATPDNKISIQNAHAAMSPVLISLRDIATV